MGIREIIFRGKRKDNGEWVFGYFVMYKNETYIFEQVEVNKGIDFDGYLDCCKMAEVIPETVGQFTGLNDKNGKKIFEGDIVKGYLGYGADENDIAYIEYQEDSMGFVLVEILKEDFGKQFEMSDDVEVIGNIYDNPELLGEEEKKGV